MLLMCRPGTMPPAAQSGVRRGELECDIAFDDLAGGHHVACLECVSSAPGAVAAVLPVCNEDGRHRCYENALGRRRPRYYETRFFHHDGFPERSFTLGPEFHPAFTTVDGKVHHQPGKVLDGQNDAGHVCAGHDVQHKGHSDGQPDVIDIDRGPQVLLHLQLAGIEGHHDVERLRNGSEVDEHVRPSAGPASVAGTDLGPKPQSTGLAGAFQPYREPCIAAGGEIEVLRQVVAVVDKLEIYGCRDEIAAAQPDILLLAGVVFGKVVGDGVVEHVKTQVCPG